MNVGKPRLIRSPEDAELAARDWLRARGFVDAEVTPTGPDSGVDVVSRDVVVQVKAEMVPTGRPVVQAISGIAAQAGKRAALFTLNGVTAQAMEFADAASVAVFRYDLQGRPAAANAAAHELELLHATGRGRPSHSLGPVGQLLRDHITDERRVRRNLEIRGFAPDATPLSAFDEAEPEPEPLNGLGPCPVSYVVPDSLFSPDDCDLPVPASPPTIPSPPPRAWLGESICITVLWVDPYPSEPVDATPLPNESAFGSDTVWESIAHEKTARGWHHPTLYVDANSDEAGGREQRELAHRLVHRNWESAVRPGAFGGVVEDEFYRLFDLTEPGGVVRALSYVEAVLQHIGTSIEKLHWWAFHDDPLVESDGPLDVRLSSNHGSVLVRDESKRIEIEQAVDNARLWPPLKPDVVAPQPPEVWRVLIPADLPSSTLDQAVDLLYQFERLGIHVESADDESTT